MSARSRRPLSALLAGSALAASTAWLITPAPCPTVADEPAAASAEAPKDLRRIHLEIAHGDGPLEQASGRNVIAVRSDGNLDFHFEVTSDDLAEWNAVFDFWSLAQREGIEQAERLSTLTIHHTALGPNARVPARAVAL